MAPRLRETHIDFAISNFAAALHTYTHTRARPSSIYIERKGWAPRAASRSDRRSLLSLLTSVIIGTRKERGARARGWFWQTEGAAGGKKLAEVSRTVNKKRRSRGTKLQGDGA